MTGRSLSRWLIIEVMINNFSHHHDTWRTPMSWCQCQHSISRECWGYTECGQLGRLQQSLQTEAGLHSLDLAPRECWTVGTPVCHHDGLWIHCTWHQCGVRRPWLWNRYIPTMHVSTSDLHGCVSWSRELHFWSISGLWSICGNLKIMQSLIHNPCDRKYI